MLKNQRHFLYEVFVKQKLCTNFYFTKILIKLNKRTDIFCKSMNMTWKFKAYKNSANKYYVILTYILLIHTYVYAAAPCLHLIHNM